MFILDFVENALYSIIVSPMFTIKNLRLQREETLHLDGFHVWSRLNIPIQYFLSRAIVWSFNQPILSTVAIDLLLPPKHKNLKHTYGTTFVSLDLIVRMLPNRKRLPWIKHSLGWLPRNGQNLSLLIERGIILQGSRRMSTTHFCLVQSITVITLWTCTRKKTGNVELFLLFMQEEQSSKNHWNASYHRFIELFHRISTFESILVDTFASGLGIKWAISLFYLTHSRSLRHGNSNRARLPKEKKLYTDGNNALTPYTVYEPVW